MAVMMPVLVPPAPILRTAPAVIAAPAIPIPAATARILHVRALVVANLCPPRLLLLRRSALLQDVRAGFGRQAFCPVRGSEFGRRREHSFGLGAFFLFFVQFGFLFGCVGGIVRGVLGLLFRGRLGHFAMFFAFDGVVHGPCGVIGCGESSFFSVALGDFFLRLGDVLRE